MYTLYSQVVDDLHETYHRPYPVHTYKCPKQAKQALEKYRSKKQDGSIYTVYFVMPTLPNQ